MVIYLISFHVFKNANLTSCAFHCSASHCCFYVSGSKSCLVLYNELSTFGRRFDRVIAWLIVKNLLARHESIARFLEVDTK